MKQFLCRIGYAARIFTNSKFFIRYLRNEEKSEKTFPRALFLILVMLTGTKTIHGFGDATHKNLPEDAILFMETQGSNQQRWAADFIKAKAGGRYSGTCVNIGYHPGNIGGDNTQCGAHGIMRVGGVKPDYFRDTFWDDLTLFSWGPPQFSYGTDQNFHSWYHFINLLERNDDNSPVITNNYNVHDGYAPNATYGNLATPIDWFLTVFMNNAQMTVDLPGCTHINCTERSSVAMGIDTNPATDYRQNGSTTPVTQGSGSMKIEMRDGTNYNCFSDISGLFLPFGACPDLGGKINGVGSYQIPNVVPGGAGYDPINFLTGRQDWVVYEPAYNVATFHYNEVWLEGFSSRNDSLQPGRIAGRYYTVTGAELLYFAVVNHFGGDATQVSHIWATQDYNHREYESWASDHYGKRLIGSSLYDNFENYDVLAQSYLNSRQNRYVGPPGDIHKLLLEQAFLTYHTANRSDADVLHSAATYKWRNAAVWAINNSIATIVLTNERAVLDLRKCRNSGACNNL